MGVFRFLASQLGNPSGWFGRAVMTHLLNRVNTELIDATLAALEIQPGDRVLDIGFGGGRALEIAIGQNAGGELVGIDRSRDAVEHARHSLSALVAARRLQLLELDVLELEVEHGPFDRILTTNTIYFWPDLDPAFEAIQRVMEPGARLCVGFGGADKMRSWTMVTRHGFHDHEDREVVAAARRNGLSPVELQPLAGRRTAGDFVLTATKS